jgi:hypothetical protein
MRASGIFNTDSQEQHIQRTRTAIKSTSDGLKFTRMRDKSNKRFIYILATLLATCLPQRTSENFRFPPVGLYPLSLSLLLLLSSSLVCCMCKFIDARRALKSNRVRGVSESQAEEREREREVEQSNEFEERN